MPKLLLPVAKALDLYKFAVQNPVINSYGFAKARKDAYLCGSNDKNLG